MEIVSVEDIFNILVEIIINEKSKSLNSRIIDIHSQTPISSKELVKIMISKFDGNNISLIKESFNLKKYHPTKHNQSEICFAHHDIFDLIDQIKL